MKDPHFFQSSFNRPNLIYEVRECKDKEKISFIANFVKVFFLIFHFFKRKNTEINPVLFIAVPVKNVKMLLPI